MSQPSRGSRLVEAGNPCARARRPRNGHRGAHAVTRIAVVDGVTAPLESATVSVQDRGFLYGDSVFETLRTYGGGPYALERRLERLERSAPLAHIGMPRDRDAIAREISLAVRAAGNAESYVRVMVTRGQ